MAKLWCYGNHMFTEECAEFCPDQEKRKQCYFETVLEKTKIKASWLKT